MKSILFFCDIFVKLFVYLLAENRITNMILSYFHILEENIPTSDEVGNFMTNKLELWFPPIIQTYRKLMNYCENFCTYPFYVGNSEETFPVVV